MIRVADLSIEARGDSQCRAGPPPGAAPADQRHRCLRAAHQQRQDRPGLGPEHTGLDILSAPARKRMVRLVVSDIPR